jgi:hypothetical protein
MATGSEASAAMAANESKENFFILIPSKNMKE